MKFSIPSDVLRNGLTAIAAALPGRSDHLLPVLANILIKADEKEIRLCATDLTVFVSLRLEGNVTRPGSAALPGRTLLDISRTLDDAPVSFDSSDVSGSGDTQGVGAVANIECGQGSFKLYGQAAEDFPDFPDVDAEKSWKMSAGDIQSLAEMTSFAVSKEQSRPILNGVLWHLGPSEESGKSLTRMVGIDGHRLAKMTLELEGGGDLPEADWIMSPKGLEQIQKLFKPDESLEVAQGENHIAFRSERADVYAGLLAGKYPDYEGVIPADNDKKARMNCAALESSVRRVAVMASGETARRVNLSFSKGVVDLEGETQDVGIARDQITADYDGENIEIGFNSKYLLDLLRHMPSEDMEMTFKSPERGVTFEPVDGGVDYFCLVMPMRVTN